jgi:hypothetical protein
VALDWPGNRSRRRHHFAEPGVRVEEPPAGAHDPEMDLRRTSPDQEQVSLQRGAVGSFESRGVRARKLRRKFALPERIGCDGRHRGSERFQRGRDKAYAIEPGARIAPAEAKGHADKSFRRLGKCRADASHWLLDG